jgi:hypothetical protein
MSSVQEINTLLDYFPKPPINYLNIWQNFFLTHITMCLSQRLVTWNINSRPNYQSLYMYSAISDCIYCPSNQDIFIYHQDELMKIELNKLSLHIHFRCNPSGDNGLISSHQCYSYTSIHQPSGSFIHKHTWTPICGTS